MALAIQVGITIPQNKEELKTVLTNEGRELVATGRAIAHTCKETGIKSIEFVHNFSLGFYTKEIVPRVNEARHETANGLRIVADKIDVKNDSSVID